MTEVFKFLMEHGGIALTILVVIILTMVGILFLIYKHWSVFVSLMTISESIPTILKNQKEIKDRHVEMSDQVKKIAAETIPNGSNQIRQAYDKIDKIEFNIEKIIDQQQVSNLKQVARLEVDKNPFFECDSKGLCISANSALCHLFGTTQEQMFGHGWGKFIIDRDQERVFRNWYRAMESKQHELSDTFTIYNPVKKANKHIEYKIVYKYNDDGSILVILGTFWEKRGLNHEEKIECLYEMSEVIKKSSTWEQIQIEAKSKTS